MKKTILIISGGSEAVPGIKKAKEMGLYVVVSDIDPNAIGFEFSDDKIIASTYDFEETASLAKKYNESTRKIDGVIAIASDVPYTVAYVANTLGLQGLSLETAMLSSDKLKMKDKFKEMNIPIPLYWEVHTLEELKEIVKTHGFPLIIKPVDSRGARGVLLLTKQDILEWAFEHSKKQSPSSKLIVEEYIDGPQVSTEAIIIDGVGYPVGFSDRNYELLNTFSPYIIENGGDMPSALSERDQDEVAKTAINAGLALGIINGIVKGDMVLSKDGPKVIEVASRLSGGWFSTDQIPLSTGVDLIKAAINQSLGIYINPKNLIPKYHKGVAIRYFFPEPGIISRINNIDLFNEKEWVYRIGFFLKSGDTISSVTNHTKRSGFVITTGKNKVEAIKNAKNVVDTVEILTL